MIFFSTGKLRKNTCFQEIRSLFSFSTTQTEIFVKNFVNKLVKLSNEFVKRLASQKSEYEAAIHRHQNFIDQVIF